MEYFKHGYARIKEHGKWGIINKSGKVILEPVYDFVTHEPAESNHEVRFLICQNGQYGFAKEDGSLLAIPQFSGARPFESDLAAVQNEKKLWGYVDAEGKIQVPFQFDDVRPFRAGRAFVCRGGRWGIVDLSGNFIVEPRCEYSDVGPFKNGITYTERYGRYGLVNDRGNIIFEPQFEVLQGYGEKLILVKFPKL